MKHVVLGLAGLASLCGAQVAFALPVNLGAAGPGNFTVLEIGTGKIDMSNPQGLVAGNVGVYAGGQVNSSGPNIDGNLYLGTGSSATFSGGAHVTGTTFTGADALLNQARADALAAAAAAKLLAGSSISDVTSSQTMNPGVYFLSNLNLNGTTLTLNGTASDSFVFNISNTLKLNSGDILLTGGLKEENVLFNFYGTQDVAFTGGGNASEMHGILLSTTRKVALSPGLVVGEIIGKYDISIVSGAEVHGITVPDAGSTAFLLLTGLGVLVAARKKSIA